MGNTRYVFNNEESIKKIDSKLLYVSTSKYEGDWHSTKHSHYFTELFYVISGKGSFVVENKTFPVKENDLVIINPNIEHTEKSYNSNPLEYIVLGIDGLSFNFDKENLNQQYSVYNFNNDKREILFYLKLLLKELEEQKKEYELICLNILEVLLIYIMRHANYAFSVTKASLSKNINRECNKIKRYLDSNYALDISLDNLADLTHMNKYYLIHAFTKYSGMSPINYLNNKRIEESKNLLATTDYSIAEISNVIGFSSQSYFSQSFKKKLRISPNEYRKQMKKKDK